jgi:hypothetical protein
LSDRFPESVKDFNDLVLHNEEYFPSQISILGEKIPGEEACRKGDDYSIVVAEHEDNTLHVLTYSLEKSPEIERHEGKGFGPAEDGGFWLYDEFDIVNGRFQHNILFSNGIELKIVFSEFHWYECEIKKQR